MVFKISTSYEEELCKKTLRAYFSLKRTIDFKYLTTKAFKNFHGALVKPLFGYTSCMPYMVRITPLTLRETWEKTRSPIRVQLRHLETGVRRSWNVPSTLHQMAPRGLQEDLQHRSVACRQRPPILLDVTKQVLEYYKRAESATPDTFIHHAFKEQMFKTINWMCEIFIVGLGWIWLQDLKGLFSLITGM